MVVVSAAMSRDTLLGTAHKEVQLSTVATSHLEDLLSMWS
jgi:hypothetical protein